MLGEIRHSKWVIVQASALAFVTFELLSLAVQFVAAGIDTCCSR